MKDNELLEILARGEDTRHQFKKDFTNADSLAAELAAFSNAVGGQLFIGVNDAGEVTGLNCVDIGRINQLLSNCASQNVRPPVNPTTLNVKTANGLVMVVDVPAGINKPYVDAQGRIWVKNGADKRHVTAREEMQRLFQQSGLVYAEEVPLDNATLADIDPRDFEQYFARRYKQPIDQSGLPLAKLLENMNLAKRGVPNLAGILLFGKTPQIFRPAFVVKAVSYIGNALHETQYIESEDIDGPLSVQYQRSLAFLKRNLRHIQGDQGFNSLGQLEIPEEVFQEVLVNALLHRDYFLSAPIKLLVFSDRVEITSPGHLPNHLNTEQIRYGLSNMRNPMLSSHATHMLPYRGLGSGIPRALHAWPQIELIDDRRGDQFKVMVPRPELKF